jgi:hypothetical protein
LDGIARLAMQRSIIENGRTCFSKYDIKASSSFFEMPTDDVLGILQTLHNIDLEAIEASVASNARREHFNSLPRRYQDYERHHPILGNHSHSYLADEYGQTYVDLFLAGYYETVARQIHNFHAYLQEIKKNIDDIDFEPVGPQQVTSECSSFQVLALKDTHLEHFDFYMLESCLVTYHTAKVENTLFTDTYRRCGEDRVLNAHLWNEIGRTEQTMHRSMLFIHQQLPEFPTPVGILQVPYLGDFSVRGRSFLQFRSTLYKDIPQVDEIEMKQQNQRFEKYMEQPRYECYIWHCSSTKSPYSVVGVGLINQYYDTVTLQNVTDCIETYEKEFKVLNSMECFTALRIYDAEKFQDEYEGRKWGLETLPKPIHYSVANVSIANPPYVPPEARNFHDVHENNRRKYLS